ncbi:MAG TPA: hypothetical protein VK914_13140 [bacterium]|jgi:hypothetical protein|nr:hypothetical protein [bacterium]
MSRRRLKRLGALLALTGLLVLNLHVLAHVFGFDHDDDGPGKKGRAAPCALCQAVLAQQTLAAAPSVAAPSGPGTFSAQAAAEAPLQRHFFAVASSTRGPPALGPA